jgi:hypothetical protein
MPLVGPPDMPPPLVGPLDPLPIAPEPGEVGLVVTPRPELLRPLVADAPEVPVEPTGAQSRLVLVPAIVAPLALPVDPVEPPVRVPDRPLVPVGPATVPAGQSLLAPEADVPCGVDDPVIPVEPVPPPVAALLVEPLGAVLAGVFCSTLLPVPRVAELTPDVLGAVLCAMASPVEHKNASMHAADAECFMRPS